MAAQPATYLPPDSDTALSAYPLYISPQRAPAICRQIIGVRLFSEKKILTQICANNFMVLKTAPRLIAGEEHLAHSVAAIRGVELLGTSPAFRTEEIGMARRE